MKINRIESFWRAALNQILEDTKDAKEREQLIKDLKEPEVLNQIEQMCHLADINVKSFFTALDNMLY
jgi:hypothetical protein